MDINCSLMMSSLVRKPSITLPLSWAVWCAGDASVLVLVLVVGAAASLTIRDTLLMASSSAFMARTRG